VWAGEPYERKLPREEILFGEVVEGWEQFALGEVAESAKDQNDARVARVARNLVAR
jgi:hypothetical protein